MIVTFRKAAALAIIATLPLLAGGCEIGAKAQEQTGFRGTGMDQITAKSRIAPAAVIPAPPYTLSGDQGPPAAQTYQNVKVLGDVPTEQFNLLMAQMNQWIAPPAAGCNYCHNPNNMASDEKYTKVVARRMLQMTRQINGQWASHVKQTGVTCYTCHRGNAVPQYKWAVAQGAPNPGSIRGNRFGQNTPSEDVAYSSLPYDPFAEYLQGPTRIRVASDQPLRSANHVVSTKAAEKTYGLMMHMSGALNVNCTYCHNSDSFRSWSNSRPQRVTAWYGIRMVRDVNTNYINSLASVFPAYRKGPLGDPYKVNCTTCHQYVNKPLGGVSMLAQAPSLRGPVTPAAAVPAAPGAESAKPVDAAPADKAAERAKEKVIAAK